MFRLLLASVLIGVQLVASGSTQEVRGRVVDAHSLQPIADAIVTAGGLNVRTAADGIFVVPTGEDEPLTRGEPTAPNCRRSRSQC